MPPSDDAIDRYPATLRHSTAQPGLVYQRSTELFAWFHPARSGDASDAAESPPDQSVRPQSAGGESIGQASVGSEMTLRTDDGARIDVCRGPVDRTTVDRTTRESGDVRAVYVEPASHRVVVPTGRVLVRFAESVQAESKREALHAAGYRIVAVLGYAPHCAWLEAASGDPAQALRDIGQIEALSDVQNVEPQWLSPRASR